MKRLLTAASKTSAPERAEMFFLARPCLAACLLAFGQAVQAEVVVTSASDAGWYSAAGSHDPNNDNYYVGYSRQVGAELRNWFTFDLPVFAEAPAAAFLRVYSSSIGSDAGSENWELREVTTPVSTLRTGGGPGLTQIFQDLGEGLAFGSRTIFPTERNTYITVSLNSNAVTAITAAAGQAFALGGLLSTISVSPTNNEFAFGLSGAPDSFVHLITVTGLSNPPVILSQPPTALSALTGSTLRFGIDAFSTEPLHYQWYFNGVMLAGQGGSSLTLSNLVTGQAGDYHVVVTNLYGAATSTVTRVTVLSQGEPTLSIHRLADGAARISWAPNTPGYVLQDTAALGGPWGNSPVTYTNGVVVDAALANRFFRLIKP